MNLISTLALLRTDISTSSRFIVHVFLILTLSICGGCSKKEIDSSVNIGEPALTLSPGGTLTVGVSTKIERSGNYNLTSGTARLSWRCTGSVTISVQSQSGNSSQRCLNSGQSVSAVGPGTITVQLAEGASVVVLAASS